MTKQQLKQLIKEVISESQVYVFGPMDAARSWISKHQAPKTKNGRQVYVVSAAEFQKAFPNIKPEPVTKMSPRMDYFAVDKEGDLMPLSQANIGSGLDEADNRERIVSDYIDALEAEIRANPLYKNVTTSKFGQNMVGYLKNGYRVAFIIDGPREIRVQLYDKEDEFVAKKTFNTIEKAIEASKNPMLLVASGRNVNVPGLVGAEVVRIMKSDDGKVYIQISDGKTIWDAVLI